jgi:LysM repeat protein
VVEVEPSSAPGETLLPTATQVVKLASATATPTAQRPSACPAPAGWTLYVIQPGDTIDSLAAQAEIPVEEFRKANCLSIITLIPNSVLFMPPAGATQTAAAPLPTPLPTLPSTLTPVPCGPPYGWVLYIVRPGDTIFRLSVALGISQDTLLRSNCMTGTRLIAGQSLFVPFIPARPPSATNTPIPPTDTATVEPTAIDTAVPITLVPTAAPTDEPIDDPTTAPTASLPTDPPVIITEGPIDTTISTPDPKQPGTEGIP